MALPTSHELDHVLSQSKQAIARSQAGPPNHGALRARRHSQRVARFTLYAGIGIAGMILLSIVWGLIVPLGVVGVMVVAMAMLGVIVLAGLLSREAQIAPSSIAQAPLPQIAERTETWLDQQRPALPPPAQTLADLIGDRLAALAPQLATIDANAPEAHELRRLVAEDLPDLVTSYRRVPANMRTTDRNGRVAVDELVAGMKLVDKQIDELAQGLAATEMDRLSSQKRYLELRYQGDEPAS